MENLMSEKKTSTLSEEDAFYWNERNVLKGMTAEETALAEKKFAISSKALADHKAGQAVKSPTDFDRKVATASDAEFARLKQDLMWQAQKEGKL
jgi:hypothetical protein